MLCNEEIMDYGKEQYEIGQSPVDHGFDDATHRGGSKAVAVGEAADLYGDVATAEHFGYVERGLAHLLETHRQ